MEHKIKHFCYMPLLGLGLFSGHRGSFWLRNRIKILKQFVVPSLLAQTNRNFTLWVSVRKQDRDDAQIQELKAYLDSVGLDNVFTYTGLCFFDDKFEVKEAELRLANALHGAMQELVNRTDGAEEILMTIAPSDDSYAIWAIDYIQKLFKDSKFQAVGYTRGYICDYTTKEVSEYNPKNNPPFYTIRFPKDTFLDSQLHMAYTALKKDVGKYKKGTPLPSHEYVDDCLRYGTIDQRGFLVGCHGFNVSTFFNHPYRGDSVSQDVFKDFGLENVEKLVVPYSLRADIFKRLPHSVRRKLRYWGSEKRWILRPLFAMIYNTLRA